MCGIVMLYRAGGTAQIAPMLAAIHHRGPDDGGSEALGDFTIGARRLAIIDVPGGHQPLANEDETVWVAFNGEIYNHAELRRELLTARHRFRAATDTEVLVHGYEQWGIEGLLGRLRGMFAFALVDTRTQTCVLARDRLGKKPLYLARAGTGWAAASEIKALFAHPSVAPAFDETRLPESLANRFVTGDRTAFANVTRLLPGHWLALTEGRVEVRRYWTPPDAVAGVAPGHEELAREVRRRVDEAVRLRLVSDVPLGALLSGGLDSSVIVAAMRDAGADPLRTYTVGFEDAASDERAAAALVARHVGSTHTERLVTLDAAAVLEDVVWHLDEPMGDPAALPTLLICRAAREHVTVVLSGEGADELFLGYPRYLLSRIADRALALPAALRRPLLHAAALLVPARARMALGRLADAPADALVRNALWMSGADPTTIAALCRRSPLNWERWYVPNAPPAPVGAAALGAVLRRDLTAWLVDDILLKVDKMSMAASLEARAPFLDHELVEFVCRLPLEARVAARGKRWLREGFADALPSETAARAKHPFRVPIAEWFRGQLGLVLEAAMVRPSSFTSHHLHRDTARRLLEAHRRGADHGQLLWNLLVHETWWRRFFSSTVSAA
jgi:asparagine synthase (glutamine-hydrolysing)